MQKFAPKSKCRQVASEEEKRWKGVDKCWRKSQDTKTTLSFYLKAKGQQLLIEVVCTLKTQKQTECVTSDHENPKGVKTQLLQ